MTVEHGSRRQCALVLRRARSLAWQAARHTPLFPVRAAMCRAWIRQAGVWAEGRAACSASPIFRELAQNLAQLEQCLDGGLPLLRASCVHIYKQ
ncbi:MAG: hypothetical protein FWF99_00670 [Desulfovibrionaceae bacterium]|nr:hypothetical protein [Desulfovibrionaceae bacterium]